MRYKEINAELFIENRKRFVSNLKPGSIAVFNSNDIMPTNADGAMQFRQNNDLFYLTGVDQEESILLLFPDNPDEKHREVLFLRETNEEIAIWEGDRLTKEKARKQSGIQTVYWLDSFQKKIQTAISRCENVYLNTNEHNRANILVESRDARFIRWCKEKYPLHHYERCAPIMQTLRMIKSDFEIELMQQACDITEKGFRRVLQCVKPGVMEYEIEAEMCHEYLSNASKGFAYTPIVASGKNACVLHYIDNSNKCQEGEVILIDAAAEYANYASDLTRAIPVSGKFTDRQKEVYHAVLRIMRQAINMLTIGNTIVQYEVEVGKLMEDELIRLGLLNAAEVKLQNPEEPLYKKYFMHGSSHFIGLDVHDVGDFHEPLKEGMVFTCEPGIYIREEGLGIRLENNILVTNKGPVDLMKNIPIEVEEIEEIMARSMVCQG